MGPLQSSTRDLRKVMEHQYLYAYFGHHKCATTSTNNVNKHLCYRLGMNFISVHNPGMFDEDLRRFVNRNKIDFLSFINADPNYINLDNVKGYHIVRDPRDIVVSAYFSHLYSHPTTAWNELSEHREKLRSTSFDEGILLEIQLEDKEFQDLYNWDYSQQNILEIKFEDMIRDRVNKFVEIFHFLGILDMSALSKRNQLLYRGISTINFINNLSKGKFPFHHKLDKIPEDEFQKIIQLSSFTRKSKGRKPGDEDLKSHYRKGISGDWKNHFTNDHKEYFKRNYNDLLRKLGYESDFNW